MKLLRPRALSVAAAGLGVALCAVGATHVFAASASSSRASQARCSLLLDCVPVVGDVVKVAVPAGVLPPGLVGIGAENGKIPSAAGGRQTINRQNYASADKPWVGPGDLQVGRKITVNVIHSDKPEDVPVTSLPD